jgi:type III secretion protein V
VSGAGGRLRSDVVVAALVLAVVAMLLVPLPRPLLDVLLAGNLALTVVLLMAAVFVTDARRLAAFPTILVVTTLLRVGLMVSTTRAILADGDGGQVVAAFGNSVAAGSLVVGLVVFAVLTVVQLLVVARGAERVAEVAARFALDALPGRQLALDADVRAGVLDPAAARDARAALARESQLYGAMDGAMRFVKGDAIAAIVIVVINLVGGLVIGVGSRGMSAADAAQTYSILSIGEGLVAQIPSLVLAVASGLLVTRVAASGGDLGERQGGALLGQPRALLAAGATMLLLALVPGLPLVPFLVLAVVTLVFGAVAHQRQATASPAAAPDDATLVIELGAELAGTSTDALVAAVRVELDRLGVPTPTLATRAPDGLAARELALRLRGAPIAWTRVAPGADVAAAAARALTPIAHELLTVDDVVAMVARTAAHQPVIVREVVPRLVAPAPLTALCRGLVREGVPVRDLGVVLEGVASAPADVLADPARLLEHVRAACARTINGRFAPRGELEVFTVDALIEDAVRDALDRRGGQPVLAIDPALARDIVAAVRAKAGDHAAVLLTSGDVRRHLRALLEDELPQVAVLAPHELGRGVVVRNAGTIAP